jgi:hypothetical protein
MPVRKNAKFLSATERENFVKACVLMKADIVNPGAPAVQQYSVWDQNVAIHNEIQNAFAPGAPARRPARCPDRRPASPYCGQAPAWCSSGKETDLHDEVRDRPGRRGPPSS